MVPFFVFIGGMGVGEQSVQKNYENKTRKCENIEKYRICSGPFGPRMANRIFIVFVSVAAP